MLKQLQDIARMSFVDIDGLHQPFDVETEWAPSSPAEVIDLAQRWCKRVQQQARPAAPTNSQQGGLALIDYIAALPDDIRDSIESLSFFRDDIDRAWQAPCADTYVSLCNTVQDVWAHTFDPEARWDSQIVEEVISRTGTRVLDFGAGAGHYAIALAQRGLLVDAVEIDSVKTGFLLHRAQAAGLADRIRVGMRWTSYDVVLAINVLDHLENPLPATKALAGKLSADGHLYILAQFPKDGWHQSDPEKVAACADFLWSSLESVASSPNGVPLLEVFSPARSDSGALCEARPALRSRVLFEQVSKGWIATTDSFGSSTCALETTTEKLCRELDGRRSIKELSYDTGHEPDALQDLCGMLHRQRMLHWLPGKSAAAGV